MHILYWSMSFGNFTIHLASSYLLTHEPTWWRSPHSLLIKNYLTHLTFRTTPWISPRISLTPHPFEIERRLFMVKHVLCPCCLDIVLGEFACSDYAVDRATKRRHLDSDRSHGPRRWPHNIQDRLSLTWSVEQHCQPTGKTIPSTLFNSL